MNPKKSPTHEGYIVKERYTAESSRQSLENAVTCGKTYVVAGIISVGPKILPDGFERVINGFEPSKNSVTFSVQDLDSIQFLPNFEAETVDTATVARRMQDEKWIEAHPHHPIAYMYWALRNYSELVKAIRSHLPLMLFQKHGSKAMCVCGGPEEQNRFILSKAGFSEAEIAEILQILPPEIKAAA